MRLTIMQPYFFPYIGYFQLVRSADKHVVYDDVNFIKNGWINRNRLLANGEEAQYFNLAAQGISSFKKINEIGLDPSPKWREKLLKTLEQNYRKAPCFGLAFPVLGEIIQHSSDNLAEYLLYSLKRTLEYLGIDTPLVESSSVYCNDGLHAQERIVDICRREAATEYVNVIGGRELYSRDAFGSSGVALRFIKSIPVEYSQFNNVFVPWLSIVDVMMFNPVEAIAPMLDSYELVEN